MGLSGSVRSIGVEPMAAASLMASFIYWKPSSVDHGRRLPIYATFTRRCKRRRCRREGFWSATVNSPMRDCWPLGVPRALSAWIVWTSGPYSTTDTLAGGSRPEGVACRRARRSLLSGERSVSDQVVTITLGSGNPRRTLWLEPSPISHP